MVVLISFGGNKEDTLLSGGKVNRLVKLTLFGGGEARDLELLCSFSFSDAYSSSIVDSCALFFRCDLPYAYCNCLKFSTISETYISCKSSYSIKYPLFLIMTLSLNSARQG